MKVLDILERIEGRFKAVSDLDLDLSEYPIHKKVQSQVKTNKAMSDKHGEVFTPLWLVDEMLDRVPDDGWLDQDKITMDLCSGYGQFSIRMLRKKYSILGEGFNIKGFLRDTHNFNEIQLSSCFKLLYVFGTGINLFIGDSRQLTKLDESDKGILYYSEAEGKWVSITNKIKEIMPTRVKFSQERCDSFVQDLTKYLEATNEPIVVD